MPRSNQTAVPPGAVSRRDVRASPVRERGALGRLVHRQLRRLRRRLLRPRVSLVYNPGYEKAMAAVPFDPLRADRTLAFLAEEGLVRRQEINVPRPADIKDVLLVHPAAYLESLQRPETLTSVFGMALGEDEIEGVLDLQRLMAGGTIYATKLALETGGVAVNLGGGFHHASASRAMGFCVFNDIAIAIARLRERGFHERILVVDLDLHDGNGTREIFAADPSVHTFSVHNDHWGETEAHASTAIALGADVGDELYLGSLLKSLPSVLESFAPRLVIYDAGCDVAADDALGNWRISPRAVLERDRFVLDAVRARSTPVAVLLGGGYGDGAWRYTARMLGWLLAGVEIEPPGNEEVTLLRFRQIKAQLDPLHLTQSASSGSGWELTEEDLVGILPGVPRQTRFLGYFSKVGVELMLERFGIFEQLRARGFRRPTLELDLDHSLGQTLRIFMDPEHTDLLVELRVDRSARVLPGFEMLSVEWLLLQDPRRDFTAERPRLPGQKHPGLGMLREFFGLLVVLAEALEVDGLTFNPSTYHVAAISAPFFGFLLPEHEAAFRATRAALAELSLDQASAAVAEGKLRDGHTGGPLEWQPTLMVLPVSERLRERCASDAFERAVADAESGLDIRLAETD